MRTDRTSIFQKKHIFKTFLGKIFDKEDLLRISGDQESFLKLSSMKDQTFRNEKGIQEIREVTIKCDKDLYKIKLRNYTSDVFILNEVFVKQCYELPPNIDINDGIIIDIGANIGLTSLFLHTHYPQAKIYAFEPVEENFELLKFNVASINNISPFKLAISDCIGQVSFSHSQDKANFGGGYLSADGLLKVPCTTLQEFCKEYGIDRISLIKLDCEGGEYSIIYSLDEACLNNINSIVGELHGEGDIKLLAYLDKYFEIGIHKELYQPVLTFTAVNRQYICERCE